MKVIKFFIRSAGAILLAAALMRFLIVAGGSPTLLMPEPALGIPLRYAVLLVGGFELVVALICLFGRQTGLQLGWLAWLATNYAVYRIGLLKMGLHQQATCIGSLTDPLHLVRGTTGLVIELIPIYLLLGSYAAVFWLWRESRAARFVAAKRGGDGRSQAGAFESLKMSCALCNGHIAFSSENLGQKVSCPHCKATITLMRPKNVKTFYPSCGGHIEFPLHGLGQTTPCPHCAVPVTLQLPV